MNVENVTTIWDIANSTVDKELSALCAPVMAASFEELCEGALFADADVEAQCLADLFCHEDFLDRVSAESELLAVSTWLDAQKIPSETATASDTPASRLELLLNELQDLLGLIDLSKIPGGWFFQFYARDCQLNANLEYRLGET